MDRSHTGSANQNTDLERQGCSPFYEELFNDPYVSTVNFTRSPSFWLSSVGVFPKALFFPLSVNTIKLFFTCSCHMASEDLGYSIINLVDHIYVYLYGIILLFDFSSVPRIYG